MYAQHFGLKQDPFSIAPDPHYLYMSERHREALAHLLYGADAGGGGFVLLTGEIGAGKTTVCRCFLEQVPAHCKVAYIFNPKLSVVELLQSVCQELQVPIAQLAPSVKECIDPLNAYLLASYAAGHNNVLIIDEAQNLSAELLEQLRLLTNLETNERKLLQIVLIGQPELQAMLRRPELEQLAQRVVARFHLGALNASETTQYIAHRMAIAGHNGVLPWSQAALRRVHSMSRGVPRRINLLCGRSLLGAYAQGQRSVGKAVVEQAAREVFDEPGLARRMPPALRWLALALGALALLALLAVLWQQGLARRASSAPPVSAAPATPEPTAKSIAKPTPPRCSQRGPTRSTPLSRPLCPTFLML